MTEAQAIHELLQAGLATPTADESFDRFARLVRRQLGVPSALVTIVLDIFVLWALIVHGDEAERAPL